MPRTLAILLVSTAMLLALSPAASAHHYNALLAPAWKCPNQTDRSLSIAVQERAMLCMYNHARKRRGRSRLSTSGALMAASDRKIADVARCGFSHYACGRDIFYWTRWYGFATGCWRAGENLAWGPGERGSVRSTMSRWLHSPGHRANILDWGFRAQGVGMLKRRSYEGGRDVQLWVAQLGYRC